MPSSVMFSVLLHHEFKKRWKEDAEGKKKFLSIKVPVE